MQNIFVYGTLLSTELVKKLTGKSFNISATILMGYKIYFVKDGDYPTIKKAGCSKTPGMVIENLDDSSLDIISFYESVEYRKKKVNLLLNSQSKDVFTFA